MKIRRIFPVLILVGVSGVAVAGGQEASQEAIPNWPAPASWSPHSASRGASTMSAVSGALPFIGLAPCRIADTRNAPGPYGAPALSGGVPRSFLLTGQCGIPSSAAVVSLNVTVTNTQGPGFILIYPQGGSQPTVSSLNYVIGQTIANAAVVPLGTGGGITVIAGVSGTDLILDTNGYYGNPTTDLSNVFLGPVAGNTAVTGLHNVGIGTGALESLTTGFDNTATGTDALLNDSTGYANTASGYSALRSNLGGYSNTAIGYQALLNNQAGYGNTAVGIDALVMNVNSLNNTAIGVSALYSNSDGNGNVAIGAPALNNISSGSYNIAVGYGAASNLTSGSNNIHIGNPGLSSESNTIRIGTGGGTHTKFFVAGVRNVTTGQADGVPVYIDGLAQLGTISSSSRVKKEIADVGEESSAILKLRPVSFLYRNDTIGIRQYGLIAEEVAAVMPELVQLSEAGDPEMVRYHFLTPLILKELQRQQKTIEQQNEVIAGLEARLAALEARPLTESHP